MRAGEQVAGRLFDAAVAVMDVLSVALGNDLGYYRCLAQHGELTAAELADETETVERYASEWLEQQAATGLLKLAGGSAEPSGQRFTLSPGVQEVMTDADSLLFLAPLARQLVATARQLPAIAQAARTGGGVGWSAYGADMRESEADLNRAAYLQLITDWLAALPDITDRLSDDPPARVADVGCGGGWSAIGLAQGFPKVRVDAFEIDPPSVALARRNIDQAGLADRIQVHCMDICRVEPDQPYVLVTLFECLHDLPHPVQALTAIHRLILPAGAVLVADMKVADTFTAPADTVERLMYGFSLLICLPDSMSTPDSAATGAVMRANTLRDYASQAGFTAVDVLPVQHDLWQFYRLRA